MTKDRVLSIVTLMVCFIMYRETYQFAKKASWQLVGPQVFPRVVIIIIALLAVIILIQSFIYENSKKEKFDFRKFWGSYGKSVVIFFVFGLYVIFLPRIHFMAATIMFLVATQALLMGVKKRKALITNLAVTLIATFSVYTIFTNFLNIWLP
ncbi:MAG: tripartite tricarboxylate transporter TctB family protein [Peptococcaceae bacterium]